MKCRMRQWILDFLHRNGFNAGKILLCGDGIGGDSMFFTQNGYDVTSFEVSRYGNAFARKMFADYGVNVTLSDSLESLPEESFDAILCLDVLEHLPDPVDSVRQSTKLLRKGGFFLFSAPFFLVGKNWPTHLESNRLYSGKVRIFEEAGAMKQVDGRFFQNPIAFQKNGGIPCRKISLFRKLFLGYGATWLKMFRWFPRIMPYLVLRILRHDPYLKELVPDEKKA
ncbi:MAG: class I SAM-dependent methyltransferase [Planctomycetia bacterium]|nr:class I SAM-dependent methyltransferase [Planctomycetia bacterium]